MKTRYRIVSVVIIGGFIAACFWQVFSRRHAPVERRGPVTLRLAHWLLQSGVRESFDQAAAEYQALHPGIVIEQVAVPIRIWPSWLRTQLVGGTAPDLVGLRNADQPTISRYFVPLTPFVDAPNPYNAGTPLEGIAWRHTFVDGLDSMRALQPATGEIPGVMLLLNTTRLFYNRSLLRTITGSDQPPADYQAFRALGRQVAAYNARTGGRLVPIASCGPYAEYLFSNLLTSQTQKLTIELSPMQTLSLKSEDVAASFLDGTLSYRRPELRASLELLRDVSALMSPGYLQMQRDDALFSFLQGNALMIYAGSWDYTVFARNDTFEVGVMPMPFPSSQDPEYGRFVLGPSAESNSGADATFGITRNSRHPEIALDFLRFLTSRHVARMFVANTYRNSAIAGVELPGHAAGLTAINEGEVPGFRPDFSLTFGGGNAGNLFRRNLPMLLDPHVEMDRFIATLDAEMPEAVRADMNRQSSRMLRNARDLDARLGLLFTKPGGDPAASLDWPRIAEIQHELQIDYLRARHRLSR